MLQKGRRERATPPQSTALEPPHPSAPLVDPCRQPLASRKVEGRVGESRRPDYSQVDMQGLLCKFVNFGEENSAGPSKLKA